MNNNTIFDNVFRTMVEKMPTLVYQYLMKFLEHIINMTKGLNS